MPSKYNNKNILILADIKSNHHGTICGNVSELECNAIIKNNKLKYVKNPKITLKLNESLLDKNKINNTIVIGIDTFNKQDPKTVMQHILSIAQENNAYTIVPIDFYNTLNAHNTSEQKEHNEQTKHPAKPSKTFSSILDQKDLIDSIYHLNNHKNIDTLDKKIDENLSKEEKIIKLKKILHKTGFQINHICKNNSDTTEQSDFEYSTEIDQNIINIVKIQHKILTGKELKEPIITNLDRSIKFAKLFKSELEDIHVKAYDKQKEGKGFFDFYKKTVNKIKSNLVYRGNTATTPDIIYGIVLTIAIICATIGVAAISPMFAPFVAGTKLLYLAFGIVSMPLIGDAAGSMFDLIDNAGDTVKESMNKVQEITINKEKSLERLAKDNGIELKKTTPVSIKNNKNKNDNIIIKYLSEISSKIKFVSPILAMIGVAAVIVNVFTLPALAVSSIIAVISFATAVRAGQASFMTPSKIIKESKPFLKNAIISTNNSNSVIKTFLEKRHSTQATQKTTESKTTQYIKPTKTIQQIEQIYKRKKIVTIAISALLSATFIATTILISSPSWIISMLIATISVMAVTYITKNKAAIGTSKSLHLLEKSIKDQKNIIIKHEINRNQTNQSQKTLLNSKYHNQYNELKEENRKRYSAISKYNAITSASIIAISSVLGVTAAIVAKITIFAIPTISIVLSATLLATSIMMAKYGIKIFFMQHSEAQNIQKRLDYAVINSTITANTVVDLANKEGEVFCSHKLSDELSLKEKVIDAKIEKIDQEILKETANKTAHQKYYKPHKILLGRIQNKYTIISFAITTAFTAIAAGLSMLTFPLLTSLTIAACVEVIGSIASEVFDDAILKTAKNDAMKLSGASAAKIIALNQEKTNLGLEKLNIKCTDKEHEADQALYNETIKKINPIPEDYMMTEKTISNIIAGPTIEKIQQINTCPCTPVAG